MNPASHMVRWRALLDYLVYSFYLHLFGLALIVFVPIHSGGPITTWLPDGSIFFLDSERPPITIEKTGSTLMPKKGNRVEQAEEATTATVIDLERTGHPAMDYESIVQAAFFPNQNEKEGMSARPESNQREQEEEQTYSQLGEKTETINPVAVQAKNTKMSDKPKVESPAIAERIVADTAGAWPQTLPVQGKTTTSDATATIDQKKEPGKSRIGMPVSEALIQKDIKIEIVIEGADMPFVLTRLFRKAHPELREKRDRDKQETVEGTIETRVSKGSEKIGTILFYVASAKKGSYTFVLENKGNKARTVDIFFHLYEEREKERAKEYKSRGLLIGGLLRFMFLMPEAFFWDDDDRFSGHAEDSVSITKFHYESGIVWSEEKESALPVQGETLREQFFKP